jgi:hypothetical protein
MITILGATLVAAGALVIMVAARMWSGKYYEANRRLATVVPYGVAPWTMPLPMAGFGITFIGIGPVMLLPRELTSIGVALLVLGGIVGIGSYLWQPKWADPPGQRRG